MTDQWKENWDKADLTGVEKRLVIKVVNRYSEQMPIIDLDNFHYTNPGYARQLLERHKDKFILMYKRMANKVLKKLEEFTFAGCLHDRTENLCPTCHECTFCGCECQKMTDQEKERGKGRIV